MSLDNVLSLTNPQLKILQSNLYKILKAKNPDPEDKEEKNKQNTPVVGKVDLSTMGYFIMVNKLKKETGRNSFTDYEVLHYDETIKKYGKLEDNLKKLEI